MRLFPTGSWLFIPIRGYEIENMVAMATKKMLFISIRSYEALIVAISCILDTVIHPYKGL